jgi:hypothetical protein
MIASIECEKRRDYLEAQAKKIACTKFRTRLERQQDALNAELAKRENDRTTYGIASPCSPQQLSAIHNTNAFKQCYDNLPHYLIQNGISSSPLRGSNGYISWDGMAFLDPYNGAGYSYGATSGTSTSYYAIHVTDTSSAIVKSYDKLCWHPARYNGWNTVGDPIRTCVSNTGYTWVEDLVNGKDWAARHATRKWISG